MTKGKNATRGSGEVDPIAAADRSTRLFMDAIVKGLVENNDATRHFGSLLGFGYHKATAVVLGLITVESDRITLTEAGRAYYQERGLADLPDGRATFWSIHKGFKG